MHRPFALAAVAVGVAVPSGAVSGALLRVPGLAETELARLWQLRESGDPTRFFLSLLAIILSPRSLDRTPVNIVELSEGSVGNKAAFTKALDDSLASALASDRRAALERAVNRLPSRSEEDFSEVARAVGARTVNFMHVASCSKLTNFEHALPWILFRGPSNRQDYCSVAEDLQIIYSKLRHGGIAVFHGGPHADTELVCSNSSVIAGGVRAAVEDFARGSMGLSGLEYGSLHAGQGMQAGLGRVFFPGAEAPYLLLRKPQVSLGDVSGTSEDAQTYIPEFSSPSLTHRLRQAFDSKDAQLLPLVQTHVPVDTETYWNWLADHVPEMPRAELRARAGHLTHKLSKEPPLQKIPKLLHQVYGFKCTNWKTGLWERSCVDQATYDSQHEKLQQCFGSGLPWASSEKQLAEAEVEWSLGVAQQVAETCCELTDRSMLAEMRIWSSVRDEMLSISVDCSDVSSWCCDEAKRILPDRQPWRSTMREDFRRWSSSWRRLHPEWKYVLWGPMEVKKLIYEQYDWLAPVVDAYPNWIYRSDVAQWIILHHFGGLYVSLDVEALEPIDTLLAGTAPPPARCKEQFMVQSAEGWQLTHGVNLLLNEDGIQREQGDVSINRLDLHVIGAIPGHPLMKSMLDSLVKHRNEFVLMATGNERLTSLFYEVGHFCADGSRIVPREVFNPIDWGNTDMRQRCFSRDCGELFKNCMGIHHHARSWFGLRSAPLLNPTKAVASNVSEG